MRWIWIPVLTGTLLTGGLSPVAAAQSLSFSDQTAAAGLTSLHAPSAWWSPLPMFGGGAAGDFDGDGWVDLFVLMGGGLPDRLFINDGDGTFTDRARDWGVDLAHAGGGVALGDYDGDGWLDLFVTSMGTGPVPTAGKHLLYRNVGGQGFVNMASAAGVSTSSTLADAFGADFGDVDLDGDLDLFVASWEFGANGNRLFRNDGDGTFTDVTATDIDGDLSTARGFTPHFVDMDGDGHPELLLAADFGTSRYLKNDGDGTFTDVTPTSGTGLDSNGMGQCVADLDGDGLFDWYVTSIAQQPDNGSGNMLYRNDGAHSFTEISETVGVNDGAWGWGALAEDFDHDGRVDLVETNGWLLLAYKDVQMFLWLNQGLSQGLPTFTESAVASGLLHPEDWGAGLLRFDPDRDGDLDLVVFSTARHLTYFRNDLSGPDTHGLTVRLDAGGVPGVAPDGEGALIRADVGGAEQMRAITGSAGYMSSSELVAHFGLGAATAVDLLTVAWPDGTVRTLGNVPADAEQVVTCCAGWKDLGAPLAGTTGLPLLTGESTMVAGEDTRLELTGGPPGGASWLVIGLSELSAPFYGGTMVPSPDILVPLPLNGAGSIVIQDGWPTGSPPGVQVWIQFWIDDPGGPFGYAASNALRLTTP